MRGTQIALGTDVTQVDTHVPWCCAPWREQAGPRGPGVRVTARGAPYREPLTQSAARTSSAARTALARRSPSQRLSPGTPVLSAKPMKTIFFGAFGNSAARRLTNCTPAAFSVVELLLKMPACGDKSCVGSCISVVASPVELWRATVTAVRPTVAWIFRLRCSAFRPVGLIFTFTTMIFLPVLALTVALPIDTRLSARTLMPSPWPSRTVCGAVIFTVQLDSVVPSGAEHGTSAVIGWFGATVPESDVPMSTVISFGMSATFRAGPLGSSPVVVGAEDEVVLDVGVGVGVGVGVARVPL